MSSEKTTKPVQPTVAPNTGKIVESSEKTITIKTQQIKPTQPTTKGK